MSVHSRTCKARFKRAHTKAQCHHCPSEALEGRRPCIHGPRSGDPPAVLHALCLPHPKDLGATRSRHPIAGPWGRPVDARPAYGLDSALLSSNRG